MVQHWFEEGELFGLGGGGDFDVDRGAGFVTVEGVADGGCGGEDD